MFAKVYLDQNAASRLATEPDGSEWGTVRRLLLRGREMQRLFCPMPLETFTESAPCVRATRIAIDQFFAAMSGGIAFKSYGTILTEATLASVRDVPCPPPYYILQGEWGGNDEAASITAERHTQARDRMQARMERYEQLSGLETQSRDDVFRSVLSERNAMFWRDLGKFVREPVSSS